MNKIAYGIGFIFGLLLKWPLHAIRIAFARNALRKLHDHG